MSSAVAYRPQHHPDEGVLMDFAAGAAREAGAVLIATHLALCPACRRAVKTLENLGGALMDELPPTVLAPHSLEAVMARLDEPDAAAHQRPSAAHAAASSDVPRPLRDYLGGPGIERFDVRVGGAGQRALESMLLLRVRAGGVIPRHTHLGTEMVVVLSGGYSDGAERFQRGDFAMADQHVDHRPVVDGDAACVCLVVLDAPSRFTGPLGFIRNWIAGR
jgi:putative transcriptional regulator